MESGIKIAKKIWDVTPFGANQIVSNKNIEPLWLIRNILIDDLIGGFDDSIDALQTKYIDE